MADRKTFADVAEELKDRPALARAEGRFSVKFESGVYHFQNLVREAYGRWLQSAEKPINPPEPLDPRYDD